jgi:ubiquinone/menaquinone biosynthesis C-methylase UbiE
VPAPSSGRALIPIKAGEKINTSGQPVKQTKVLHKASQLAWGIAAKVKHSLFPRKDYVIYRGSRLPRPGIRLNGPVYEDDEFFLNSAIKEAARVVTKLGCTPGDFLVDVGCGHSRLAIGLVRELSNLRYLGLDVADSFIQWCQQHIESQYPSYRFQHIDLINARYNPSGHALAPDFRLPVADAAADIVYMWGVVTNMEPDHFPIYASEISRILRRGGRLYLTANVEDQVPMVSINPENYTAFTCQGPLHIVRYEKQYFLGVFQRAGLILTDFEHHAAGNCQSDMYFVKQ